MPMVMAAHRLGHSIAIVRARDPTNHTQNSSGDIGVIKSGTLAENGARILIVLVVGKVLVVIYVV